jgi:hypothetical protein
MAEEHARWKQYEYAANSNLVLTADRRSRENEPSGEAESLAAVAKRKGDKMPRMGDRVLHSRPQALIDKKEKIEKKRRERKDKDEARKKAKVWHPYPASLSVLISASAGPPLPAHPHFLLSRKQPVLSPPHFLFAPVVLAGVQDIRDLGRAVCSVFFILQVLLTNFLSHRRGAVF